MVIHVNPLFQWPFSLAPCFFRWYMSFKAPWMFQASACANGPASAEICVSAEAVGGAFAIPTDDKGADDSCVDLAAANLNHGQKPWKTPLI